MPQPAQEKKFFIPPSSTITLPQSEYETCFNTGLWPDPITAKGSQIECNKKSENNFIKIICPTGYSLTKYDSKNQTFTYTCPVGT